MFLVVSGSEEHHIRSDREQRETDRELMENYGCSTGTQNVGSSLQFYITKKQNRGIIYHGYKFVQRKTISKTTLTFRCLSYHTCHATLTTYTNYSIKNCDNAHPTKHNHDSHASGPSVSSDSSALHCSSLVSSDDLKFYEVNKPEPVPFQQCVRHRTNGDHHNDFLPPNIESDKPTNVDSGLQFYTTKNQNRGIIYLGYKFEQKNTYNSKTTLQFRCHLYSSKHCLATLTTYTNFSIKNCDNAHPTKHNHDSHASGPSVSSDSSALQCSSDDPKIYEYNKPKPVPYQQYVQPKVNGDHHNAFLPPNIKLAERPRPSRSEDRPNIESDKPAKVDSGLQFYTTRKGNRGIIYHGYKFAQRKTISSKTTIRFRCLSHLTCRATLTTHPNFSIKNCNNAHPTKHNHDPPKIDLDSVKQKSKYKCDLCNKDFAMLSETQTHLAAQHLGHYKCKKCGWTFELKSSLDDHKIEVHSSQKPHLCEICGKQFDRKIKLSDHQLTVHLGLKLHQCDQCGRQFTTKRQLCYHKISVHLGKRPHKCDFCGKRFSLQHQLFRHKNNHLK